MSTWQLELSATLTHASSADRRSRGASLIQGSSRCQLDATADELTHAIAPLYVIDALTTASMQRLQAACAERVLERDGDGVLRDSKGPRCICTGEAAVHHRLHRQLAHVSAKAVRRGSGCKSRKKMSKEARAGPEKGWEQ
jgi:hypothetical protein